MVTLMDPMGKILSNLKSEVPCSICRLKQVEYGDDREPSCEDCRYNWWARVKDKMADQIGPMLKSYGIPDKFMDHDYRIPDWISKYVPKPGSRGLFLHGDVGVGKTVTATAVARLHLESLCAFSSPGGAFKANLWHFISFPEFIMRIQSANREGSSISAYDILDHTAHIPNLIIDDMGVEKPSEYVRQATYFLINEREMRELPTFITSNFTLDALKRHIDDRISSRIRGMCDVVELFGGDRRATPDRRAI